MALDEKPTGYEPVNILKSIAPNIWIADGGRIKFYRVPFPTRMTVVRLSTGDMWIHSPIEISNRLSEQVESLGPVRYLVAPNWIHYASIPAWQQRFPEADTFVSPGVVQRAANQGMQLRYDQELSNTPPAVWAEEFDQRLADSGIHRELIFFHRASRSLILTDLIENFESNKVPWWMRPLIRLGGVCDPDGKMPRDMATSFMRHPQHIRSLVADMIAWAPERVVLAHGRWYKENGTAELRRAFRRYLP